MQILMNVFVYQEFKVRCLVLFLSFYYPKEWPHISKYSALLDVVDDSQHPVSALFAARLSNGCCIKVNVFLEVTNLNLGHFISQLFSFPRRIFNSGDLLLWLLFFFPNTLPATAVWHWSVNTLIHSPCYWNVQYRHFLLLRLSPSPPLPASGRCI